MRWGYKVATYEKQQYKGELLTYNQWIRKGYKPKDGVNPHEMWSNQNVCSSGNPNRYVFDYYYDYEVELIK